MIWPRVWLGLWLFGLGLSYSNTVDLLSVLQPWFFAPALPLLLWAIPQRRRWLSAMTIFIGLIWLWLYAERWLPQPRPDTTPALRLLSWNVAGWNLNSADILRVIDQEQPDLIALQEVDVGLAKPLQTALASRYPYVEFRPASGAAQPADLALWSKWPFELIQPCAYWQCYRRAYRVQYHQQPLILVNVHIEHSPIRWLRFEREREDAAIEQMIADFGRTTEPLLLAGDFNTVEQQAGYTALNTVWGDSWRERGVGMGFSWPQRLWHPPMVRIDYIWHNAAIRPIQLETGAGVSDHRYLIGAFDF